MLPVRSVLTKFWKIRKDNKIVYVTSSMVFFWAIFDGILSYLVPIFITHQGFSDSAMGLIIASSSLVGAIFDFVLSRIIRNSNYRRLFIFVYLLCVVYPLSLWFSKTIVFFIIAMAIWGIYYDIQAFATYDLLQKNSNNDEHCLKSGIILVFVSLGYLISPIIAGLLVVDSITFLPLGFSLLFLLMSFLSFLVLLHFTKNPPSPSKSYTLQKRGLLDELKIWAKVDVLLLPVIIFTILMFIQESFFWTIGPLFSDVYPNFVGFGGLVVAMSSLPFLFTGWFVEKITHKFGKKKTAYFSFLISSIILFFIFLFHQPIIILLIIFISTIFVSISHVAIKGAFVDYISESHNVEKEIEGSSDLSSNLGYILGPITAGIVADAVGVQAAFSVMALVSIIILAFVFTITPKHINVKVTC